MNIPTSWETYKTEFESHGWVEISPTPTTWIAGQPIACGHPGCSVQMQPHLFGNSSRTPSRYVVLVCKECGNYFPIGYF